MQSVNFAYPTRPDQRVLADASFHIEAGRVTALVGPSGGGKSTVVNLIERFYDVDAKAGSRLTLDGVPVCELDSSWLRTRIGLVRQEPQLFCATISENIAVRRRRRRVSAGECCHASTSVTPRLRWRAVVRPGASWVPALTTSPVATIGCARVLAVRRQECHHARHCVCRQARQRAHLHHEVPQS